MATIYSETSSSRDPATRFPRAPRLGVAAFLARRLAAALLVLVAASLIVFFATNVLPGNVAVALLGRHATPERVELLETRLGLDQPVTQRYGSWAAAIVRGDLGESAVAVAQGASKTAIASLISVPLRNSAALALITILLLLPLSVVLGAIAGLRAGRAADYGISYTALALMAFPEFVMGTFLILIFFSQLNLLPPLALLPPGAMPYSHPRLLVLPMLTLLASALGFSARQVRAGMVEIMRQDFVTMARLNGIRERRILWRYALRNALVPSIQTFAQTAQYLVGGLIIVEALFAYPGIGNLFRTAVAQRDLPLVSSVAVILAAIYIVINIVADLLVVFLVPKLRTGLSS